MKKFLFLIYSIIAVLGVSAQQTILHGSQAENYLNGAEVIRINEGSEIPSYIRFSEEINFDVNQAIHLIKKEFNLTTEVDFKLLATEENKELAEKHLKYIQTYNGLDIEFSRLIVHVVNGRVSALNMDIVRPENMNSSPSITVEEARKAALAFVDAKIYKWEIPEEENFLKEEQANEQATFFPNAELVIFPQSIEMFSQNLVAAFRFDIYAHEPLYRADVYVDAKTSKVLFINNKIHHANTQGIAITKYSGTQTITTDSLSPNQYVLKSTDRGNGINTYNMQQGTSYGNAVNFTDTDNFWNNVNFQKDEVATDAHWGTQMTYDFFYSSFNRNSIDGNGFPLNSYVHYDNAYSNAFWDGGRMTYGDGSGSTNPYTALDITGHEIAHGLTNFTADLVYSQESGALNESFSDIFGSAIEFFARPNNSNWTLGEDIGYIIRSLSNPKQYGDPDTRNGINWQNPNCVPTGANDLCGVHTNSGVQNHWFYLLTNGGSGVNDLNNSYNVSGIGIGKSAAIAYRNLTVYLTPLSNYDDARYYSIQSAIDLYGVCSPEVEATTKAWYAVGVGNDYIPGVVADFEAASTAFCVAPQTVDFNFTGSNGLNYIWDFGDGSPASTSVNPSHQYTFLGDYNVTLIVDGGTCGQDTLTKTSYISIDTLNPCSFSLVDGINSVQTECSGKFYDTGGPSAKYDNHETVTMTISPANASSVTLNFIYFDVENGSISSVCDYDYFEVYDGPSTSSTLIGRYCNNIPPPSNITSTTGDITIKFSSDPALELNGFEIGWNCSYPTSPPVAAFSTDRDSTCTGEVAFFDNSLNAPTSHIWYFGDGKMSTLKNPVHYYRQNGIYNVKLKVENAFGSDSIIKNSVILVNSPTAPASINDSICKGQNASLSVGNSTAGINRWYSDSVGGIPIAQGPTFVLNNVDADTNFYVEDFVAGSVSNVGAAVSSIGSNGGYFNGDQYMIFDVYQPLTIESVTISSNSTKSRTIELRDANGNLIDSKTFTFGFGTAPIPLDFDVQPGTDYRLGFPLGSQPSLYRNNNGVSYPYTVPGLINIENSSAGTQYYYFFYNWKVREMDCVSPRSVAKVIVDSNCVTTFTVPKVLSAENLNVFPNPTTENINITIDNFKGELDRIALYAIDGRLVNEINSTINIDGSYAQKINISHLEKGVYVVKIHAQEKIFNQKIVVVR